MNDQVVRMALFRGEAHWHRHGGKDKLFYVYIGEVTIKIRGSPDVVLGAGEMAVVPMDVEHRPESVGPSYVLMFEPLRLRSQGD